MGFLKNHKQTGEHLILVSQLGLTMAGSIGFGFAVGYYLDRWLKTGGLLLTLFILLGVVGGGWTCYRQIMEVNQADQDEEGRNAK